MMPHRKKLIEVAPHQRGIGAGGEKIEQEKRVQMQYKSNLIAKCLFFHSLFMLILR